MQTAGARTDQILVCAPLDDGNVDSCQSQLACQHQPGRSSPGNDYRVPGRRFDTHLQSPKVAQFLLWPAILRHDPGLAASPRVRYMLKVRN